MLCMHEYMDDGWMDIWINIDDGYSYKWMTVYACTTVYKITANKIASSKLEY